MISSLVIVAAETALKVLREKDLSQSRQARKEVLKRKGIAQAVPRHPQFYIRSHEMKTVLIAACASLATIFVIRPIEKKKGGE